MADQVQNQTSSQSQQTPGGESQDGQQQQQSQQTPPQQTQAPGLPKELADLGFRDVNQVLGYMAEAGDEARKSKAMFKALADQVQGRQQVPEKELTDEDFIQSPKAATERATKKLFSQFEDRINPLASQLVEGNVTLQKMQLRQDPVFGEFVDDLEKDLDAYLATIPPDLKVRPNAVRTAMEYVVGRNFTTVSKKLNERLARAGAGAEGGSNSSSGGGGAAKAPTLGDDERAAAQKQINAGIFKDMEDYLKWRE